MSFQSRFGSWQVTQQAQEYESNRINFLRTATIPQNPAELTAATKVRVLKATFCIKGKPVVLDSIITLPLHDAVSLKAAGKVEFI